MHLNFWVNYSFKICLNNFKSPWGLLGAKLELKIKITTQTQRYSQEHPFIQSVKGAALTCFSYYGKEIVINTCISPWALEGVWTEKGAARGVQTRPEPPRVHSTLNASECPAQQKSTKVNTKKKMDGQYQGGTTRAPNTCPSLWLSLITVINKSQPTRTPASRTRESETIAYFVCGKKQVVVKPTTSAFAGEFSS